MPTGEEYLEYLEKLEKENDQFQSYWSELKEKVIQHIDWRNGWSHKELYNKLAYLSGYLHKLEFCRRNISIESLENYIGLMHVLGFSFKRIYVAIQDAIKEHNLPTVVTMAQIQSYIRGERGWKWVRAKQEFDKGFKEERMKIFANLYGQFFDIEEKLLKIQMAKIADLTEALAKLDPVAQPTDFKRISRMLEDLTTKVKEAHGITDMRKTAVLVSGEAAKIAIAKKMEGELNEGKKTVQEAFAEIIEDGSHLLPSGSGDE